MLGDQQLRTACVHCCDAAFEGSKVDVLNKNAESPLHLAIRMMHADVVELLVNHGN